MQHARLSFLKKSELKIYHLFRKVSFYKRLLILFLLLLCFIFFSLSALVFQSIHDYRKTIAFESSQIISSYEKTLSRAISTLDSVTKFQIVQNAHSSSGIFTLLETGNDKWGHDYELNNTVLHELKPLYDIDSAIYLISIQDRNNTHVYSYKDAIVYHTLQDEPNAAYLRKAGNARGRMVVMNSEQLDSPLLTLPENSLCGVRSLMSFLPMEVIGTSLCCIDVSEAEMSFQLGKRFPQEKIGYFSADNDLLLGTLSPDLAALLRKTETIQPNELNSRLLSISGTTYLLYYTLSDYDNLCVISIPYHDLISDILAKNIYIFSLLLASVTVMIFLAKILIDSIKNPILQLSEACQSIRDGNLGIIIEDSASDEMHQLIDSFNKMSERIAFLIDEVYRKETMQSQTELQLLRSQINPHFIYNTLETIRSAAIIRHDHEIIEMVSLFGQLLRYSISNTNPLVTVAQVKDYLCNYILLQQLHYKNNIIFNTTFDPQIENCYMLKLLLQPLLENCIYHGAASVDEPIKIDVMGYLEYGCLVFKVSDNGRGMDPETVQQINDYIHEKNDAFNSIGLRNVNRRIKLFYGEDYGILFESIEDHGSIVTVTIPTMMTNTHHIQESERTPI